jgi:hypothetical protein
MGEMVKGVVSVKQGTHLGPFMPSSSRAGFAAPRCAEVR